MAWLDVTPKEADKSRLSSLKAQGLEPDYPPTDGAEDLLDCLASVGYFRSGISGATGIDFTEIQAWATGTGQGLTHWECETLFVLSRVYAAGLNRFSEVGAEAPYQIYSRQTELDLLDRLFNSIPTS